jgi:hypothetical protein
LSSKDGRAESQRLDSRHAPTREEAQSDRKYVITEVVLQERGHDNKPRLLRHAEPPSLHPSDTVRVVNAQTTEGLYILPWTSPTARSTPVDQLTAAILDGDTGRIGKVVANGRGGNDLRSEFWSGLCANTLPLHRAVSGLNFHGSEKLVVRTLEVLLDLGADIRAVDQAGNSVLHKAVTVCTSQSVASVVRTLLTRGADASAVCKNGYTAMHLECWRYLYN